MIIGLTTVKVAPATTGSRTPRILPMPALWITVAIPETSRSALTSSPIVDAGSLSAPPTISGTATAPAYMMNRCCKPRTANRCGGSTSSTGWTTLRRSGLAGWDWVSDITQLLRDEMASPGYRHPTAGAHLQAAELGGRPSQQPLGEWTCALLRGVMPWRVVDIPHVGATRRSLTPSLSHVSILPAKLVQDV